MSLMNHKALAHWDSSELTGASPPLPPPSTGTSLLPLFSSLLHLLLPPLLLSFPPSLNLPSPTLLFFFNSLLSSSLLILQPNTLKTISVFSMCLSPVKRRVCSCVVAR